MELPCRAIGATSVNWTFNGKPYAAKIDNQSPSKESARAGTNGKVAIKSENLLLADLQPKDSGNYTCSSRNGVESATYHLTVIGSFIFFIIQPKTNDCNCGLAPPSSPTIHVIQTTVDQIHVQWKQINNGGSPLLGYLLHWRQADGGDWLEFELDRLAITAQLDVRLSLSLSCTRDVIS